MNRFKKFSALFLVVLALVSTSCTEDPTMDELIGNSEISNPSSDGNDNGEKDKPGGG